MDAYTGESFGNGIRTRDVSSKCNCSEKSELSGIGSGSADESFHSMIITTDRAPDGKAQPEFLHTLYENTVSAAAMDNINEKNQVHPIWGSIDTGCFEHILLCGIDTRCRKNLSLQGPMSEKWCTLLTLCMFFFIFLLGLFASTLSDLTSRLVSDVILEEQLDCQSLV